MADALKAEGNALFAQGLFAEAAAKYAEAISLDASSAVLFSNRSAAHLGAGNAAAALADAERALTADPAYAKGYLRKNKALRALGRPAHAEAALRAGQAALPSDPILVAAMKDFLVLEDGKQSELSGVMPGTPAHRMRTFQSEQGMQMHRTAFLKLLPSEAHRQAFLGNAAAFAAGQPRWNLTT